MPLEVHAQKVAELGLDASALDLTSIEAMAGALRRAASFLCPCAAATLVRTVVRPLRGLVGDLDEAKTLVEETLEAMVVHGDILEHRDLDEKPGRRAGALLYAAPPCFVARQSGSVLLLGVVSDQLSALPDDLEARIECVNHLRRLSPLTGENLIAELIDLGLMELPYVAWLKSPAIESSAQYLLRIDRLLDTVQPSRDVPGLRLLDPGRPVHYYPGRWVDPRSQSGRFVARRSQAYGAPLWCYVQLHNGNPERIIDFPIGVSRWRGCDEAWRLQMAIDAQRGEPQRFRVLPSVSHSNLLQFFSPLPMWARRRLDAVGEPVLSHECLFAYRLTDAELGQELRFAHDELWLEAVSERPPRG